MRVDIVCASFHRFLCLSYFRQTPLAKYIAREKHKLPVGTRQAINLVKVNFYCLSLYYPTVLLLLNFTRSFFLNFFREEIAPIILLT